MLSSKTTVNLKPADVVSYQICGGGYGPPAERDPALVLRDVREAKVSLERARAVYKVAVDPGTWTVDETETARLRGTSYWPSPRWDSSRSIAGDRSRRRSSATGSREPRGRRFDLEIAQLHDLDAGLTQRRQAFLIRLLRHVKALATLRLEAGRAPT